MAQKPLVRRFAKLTDHFHVAQGARRMLDQKANSVHAPYFVRKEAKGFAVYGTIQADENGKPWNICRVLEHSPAEGGAFWPNFGNLKTKREACELGARVFGQNFNAKL